MRMSQVQGKVGGAAYQATEGNVSHLLQRTIRAQGTATDACLSDESLLPQGTESRHLLLGSGTLLDERARQGGDNGKKANRNRYYLSDISKCADYICMLAEFVMWIHI